jgi:phospholipase D1/2
VKVAIARTEPPYDGEPLVNEIENLFLDSIKAAKDTIYVESQYFAAESICDALQERLEEPDGPEIIIINPQSAQSEFEDDSMHVTRNRMIKQLRDADHHDKFRIYHPVNAAEEPIYVHAKIMITDTKLIHLGSSNINNRSMGFDTECDMALDDNATLIGNMRTKLVCEHIDADPQEFAEALERTGSLIATIEELNRPNGRGLRDLQKRPENLRGKVLAATRFMDPRYTHSDDSSAGKGVRPRHLALVLGVSLIGYLGWWLWGR